MYKILKTETFEKWLRKLKDIRAKGLILAKIKKAECGNLGNVRSVGKRVSEIIIDYGPGYRIYYTKVHEITVILLVGGDKSSQDSDIKNAQRIAAEIGDYDEKRKRF